MFMSNLDRLFTRDGMKFEFLQTSICIIVIGWRTCMLYDDTHSFSTIFINTYAIVGHDMTLQQLSSAKAMYGRRKQMKMRRIVIIIIINVCCQLMLIVKILKTRRKICFAFLPLFFVIHEFTRLLRHNENCSVLRSLCLLSTSRSYIQLYMTDPALHCLEQRSARQFIEPPPSED